MEIKCRIEKVRNTFIIMKPLITNSDFSLLIKNTELLYLLGSLVWSRELNYLGGYGIKATKCEFRE